MKASIKEELTSYVLELINDKVLTDDNRDDWHFHAFNKEYYIICLLYTSPSPRDRS